MIPLTDFIPLICAAVPRFQVNAPNHQQETCILHDAAVPLMIVTVRICEWLDARTGRSYDIHEKSCG
jgi:hypothetical protein